MTHLPADPEPVEPMLWAALLVGTETALPCHFGSAISWPCNARSCDRWCQDLHDRHEPGDIARHSMEAGSATVPCSGPAAFVVDLSETAVVVPTCDAHFDWLERHAWRDSVSGPISAIRWRGEPAWSLPNHLPERQAEVEAELLGWRDWLGGRAVDPSDRSVMALLSRLAPASLHNWTWERQIATAVRLADRSRRRDGS